MGRFLLLAASPETSVSVFDPASPSADSIRSLFFLVVAVCAGILFIVEAVLIYSLLRFRRRPAAASDPAANHEPPQVYGSTPIEIAWTTAPALIVFIFILALFRTEGKVRLDPANPPPGSEPLHVTVIGHQWWWEYRYEKLGDQPIRDGDGNKVVTANELRVPVSEPDIPRPIFLKLESADVCHSFWVPRLAGKIDLIPGRTNELWFQTEKTGVFLGQCAEYCGTQHANMLLRVEVQKRADFQRWLDDEKKPALAPANPELQRGRDVFLRTSCVNCHRIRGTGARGTFGPDLTHVGSRKTLASGMVGNELDQLYSWIRDPQKTKPGCLMPAMKLTPREIHLVTAYLYSLR